ncbi:Dual specificity protein phosphatase 19 [Trichinella pseudospiralis]|uniref:protein-serine/threonine phosphatase n=1 Tax=Trichinella pseudospiralis TaxID=6337 RepID=A0A0V1EVJ0_TRIPS|nr:Dual specificity protein phosphatase 19 [Trichinella pseudospiralis]
MKISGVLTLFMKIIELITEKRRHLRSVHTKVTLPDGRSYIEQTGELVVPSSVDHPPGMYFVLDRSDDNSLAEILPHLLLSSQEPATKLHLLQQHRVTHILDLASSFTNRYADQFIYKRIEIFDCPMANIKRYFNECVDFIDEVRMQNGRVLVHCNAGVSRSPTIVVAYLMKRENYTLENALSFVRAKRPCIRPNNGFMKQLKEFENELKQL